MHVGEKERNPAGREGPGKEETIACDAEWKWIRHLSCRSPNRTKADNRTLTTWARRFLIADSLSRLILLDREKLKGCMLFSKTKQTKQNKEHEKAREKKNRKTPAVLKTQQDDGKAIDFLYFVTVEC